LCFADLDYLFDESHLDTAAKWIAYGECRRNSGTNLSPVVFQSVLLIGHHVSQPFFADPTVLGSGTGTNDGDGAGDEADEDEDEDEGDGAAAKKKQMLIIGGAVGGTVFLLIVVGLCCCCMKGKKSKHSRMVVSPTAPAVSPIAPPDALPSFGMEEV
jgi:hypothetical protein